MAHLIHHEPDGVSKRRELSDVVLLGRQPDCDVVVRSPTVSRRHARITREGSEWWLRDLDSTRGTRVNGARVQHVALSDGDRIDIGGELLVFGADLLVSNPSFDSTSSSIVEENSVESNELMQSITSVMRNPSVSSGAMGATGSSGDREDLLALIRTSEQLRRCSTIEEVGKVALDMAIDIVGAERGAVARFAEDGTEVGLQTASTLGDQAIQPSRTFIDTMRAKGVALIALDTALDADLASAQSIVAQDIRSILCAPLWDGAKVVGYLYLDSSTRRFRRQDLDLIVVIGYQAAAEVARLEHMQRALQAEERRRHLSRFLSADVVQRLEEEEATGKPDALLEAGEAVITVVHADLDGLVALTGQMRPMEVKTFLDEHLEAMTTIAVDRFGGTLDQYLGGGMRVVFGAPTSRGRSVDASMALGAALAMRDHVEALRHRSQAYASIRLRVGVHAGTVVVGMMGSYRRSEYSVVGGVVQLAAQVTGACMAGRVLCTKTVYGLAGRAFECVPAMDRSVAGPDGVEVCFWVVRGVA